MTNKFQFFDIYLLDTTYDTADVVIRHNKYYFDSNRVVYNPTIKDKLNRTEYKVFNRFKNHMNRVYDLTLTDGSIARDEKKRLKNILEGKSKYKFIQSDFTAHVDGFKIPCHVWVGRHDAMKGLYHVINQKVIL